MITFVFPGQGVQKKGMGKELFEKYQEYVDKADQILGYSIKELCLDNPENKLNFTAYTQVAIYVVNCLEYLEYVEKTGIEPDFVAGHSLGEYNALFASKVFDFETGLKLVKKRGELMGKVSGGAMAAVIGMQKEELCTVLEKHADLNLYIGNYNTDTQLILSGSKEDILRGSKVFQDLGIRYSILNVSGAFHSPYMSQPRNEFAEVAEDCEFHKGKIPVIANISAQPYNWDVTANNLIEQIDSSVRWSDTIKYLIDNGVRHFVEIGNTHILKNMIKAIQSSYIPKANNQNNEGEIPIEDLGNTSFRERYNLTCNCLIGGMYRAISSKEMIVNLCKAGLMGFYGTGGVKYQQIVEDIEGIQKDVKKKTFGVNIVGDVTNSGKEDRIIDLLLEKEVHVIEASGYLYLTKPLIRFIANGLHEENGRIIRENHIIAKISRPEIAEIFMKPASDKLIMELVSSGEITERQAALLRRISVADDICVESDSGGHTDRGMSIVLLPTIQRMRNRLSIEFNYQDRIHVGASGGIGTAEAAAVMFVLGADFIMTGSINQCTLEAGTSKYVKQMLCKLEEQDTDYAPAGDMLEYGSQVQVVKKGTFFIGRANKLYDIYKHNESIESLEKETKEQIEKSIFHNTLENILEEEMEYFKIHREKEYQRLVEDKKYQLLIVLKWYFRNSTEFALNGNTERKVDYQIQCGKSMGAFNDWVRNTKFSKLENRTVVDINQYLMLETSRYLSTLSFKG